MSRLWRFLALFGLGLIGLVVALGPSRILRRSNEPKIRPTDLSGVHAPLQVSDPTQGGRSIGFAVQGAGQIPFWDERIEADGSTTRVKSAELEFRSVEPFPGGFHFTEPRFTFFPAKGPAEKPTATVRAGGADLATQSDLSHFTQGRMQSRELKGVALSGGVVVEQLDENGVVALTLETERIESATIDPDRPASDTTTVFDHLTAPGPIHLFRADGTFDLHGGGCVADRPSGTLTISAPIALTLPEARVTADGPAVFTRAAETAAAPAAPTTASSLAGLQQAFGPGELLLTRNVDVEQPGRWLRTDRVAVTIGRAADGSLAVTRVIAGQAPARVTLGLFSGEGTAVALDYSPTQAPIKTTPAAPATPADGALVLTGPVELRDLVLGDGASAKKLTLSSQGDLTIRELPADDRLPARRQLTLNRVAHATIPGELDAHAETLVAELVELPADPKTGAGASFHLLSTELTGGAERAIATLPGRGTAQAQRITLREGERASRLAHLEGDARVEVAQGFVTGTTIDVTAPSAPDAPITLIVPHLTGGELALPAGVAPLALAGRVRRRDDPPSSAQKLVLEPLAACRLKRTGDALELVGRCRYHVRDAADTVPQDPQTLECDELYLLPAERAARSGRDAFDLRMRGGVDLVDRENGLHVTAAFAHTESNSDGNAHLILDGTPATVTFESPAAVKASGPVRAAAARLTLDLATHELEADDPRGRVVLLVPAAFFGPLLSAPLADAGNDAAPADARAELRAEHLVFKPGSGATMHEQSMAARFLVERRVDLFRPFDGAGADRTLGTRLLCERLEGDLAKGRVRADGGEESPVVLTQPKRYAPERVQSVTTAWMEVQGHGERFDFAPGALFVFHPEEAPTPAHPVPPLRRVKVVAADAPELRGARLAFGGGVDSEVRLGDGTPITLHSERLELLLNHGLDEKGPITLVKLNASQRVRLDQEPLHAEGNLYTLDLHPEDDLILSFELKEGTQPCAFLGQDARGEWFTTAHFRRMRGRVPPEGGALSPRDSLEIEGLELLVEGPRGR